MYQIGRTFEAKHKRSDKVPEALTLFLLFARFIRSFPIPCRTIFIEVRRLSNTAGCEKCKHFIYLYCNLQKTQLYYLKILDIYLNVWYLETKKFLFGEATTVYYLDLSDYCALSTLCNACHTNIKHCFRTNNECIREQLQNAI